MRPDEPSDDREIDEMLSRLDHPVPPIPVETVIARARTSQVDRLRWAAGIALALAIAAGGAYAAPGSPVPRWIADAGRALGLATAVSVPSVPAGAPPSVEEAGLALIPGEVLVIEFLEPQLSGHLRVDFTDDAEVVVRAPMGTTRFVSEPERLLIEHPTPDTVSVLLPRDAQRIVIRVGVRVLLQRSGEEISSAEPATVDGGYVFPLGRGGG